MRISNEHKKTFHISSLKSVWLCLLVLFVCLCIFAMRESNRSPKYTYEYKVMACRYDSPINGVSHCSDELVIKIRSHRNPFVISFPNKPEIVYNHSNDASSFHDQSMSVEELPHRFAINGISFVMTDTGLRCGGQIWPLQPREPVEVNIDEFTDRMQKQLGKS
jgi:hypothetical protein